MSSRFGRNQRRQMRERIAELERYHYHGSQPASKEAIPLERFGVSSYDVTINDTRGSRIERTASVTVRYDREVQDAFYNRNSVSFQGVQYMVVSADIPARQMLLQEEQVQLSLVGYVSSRPVAKRPAPRHNRR